MRSLGTFNSFPVPMPHQEVASVPPPLGIFSCQQNMAKVMLCPLWPWPLRGQAGPALCLLAPDPPYKMVQATLRRGGHKKKHRGTRCVSVQSRGSLDDSHHTRDTRQKPLRARRDNNIVSFRPLCFEVVCSEVIDK